jgi:hypothetical protein
MEIIKNKKYINKLNFDKNIFPKQCSQYKYQPVIMNAVERIVVLGDIHGDYDLAISMLKIGKVISVDVNGIIQWIGGNSVVVQIGDQIDSCRPNKNKQCNDPETTINDKPSDIKLLMLFTELHNMAIANGGAVISLLGNHEIMNSEGQVNYVSYENLKEANGITGRIDMFKPGSKMGKFMGCTRQVAVIIGSNMFVHAGVIDLLINDLSIDVMNSHNDLELINIAVKMWLLGLEDKETIKKIIAPTDISLFWTRKLGNIMPNQTMENLDCKKNVSTALNVFKVGSVIIGHTPQSFMYSESINGTCDNKVWRVDNGSSSAFHAFDSNYMRNNKVLNARRPQVLVIENDTNYKLYDNINSNLHFDISGKVSVKTDILFN